MRDKETKNIRSASLLMCAVLFGTAACASDINACKPGAGVTLQVLGSGGPIADDGRASAAYLVWVDGESKVLIDAGGGAFLRFGEAGADFASLDFIGISHFHTDHSADLPTLLKSGYFSNRRRNLAIGGPDSSVPESVEHFPGLNTFLDSLFREPDGAYAYLSGVFDGSGGMVQIDAIEIANNGSQTVNVYGDDDTPLQISASHVPHGIVPSIAYRVRVGDTSIVFGSDQNGNDPAFAKFAKDATLLVMHMPVPEDIAGLGRRLHAPPSVIASIASKANAETLLLSHLMQRSLRDLDGNVELVKAGYDGRVIVANDLDCLSLNTG